MSRRFRETGRKNNTGRAGMLSQFVIFTGIIVMMFSLNRYLKNPDNFEYPSDNVLIDFRDQDASSDSYLLESFQPALDSQEIIQQEYFSIGLDQQKRTSWFAQELWADQWDSIYQPETPLEIPAQYQKAPSGMKTVLLGSSSDLNFSKEILEAAFSPENYCFMHETVAEKNWTDLDSLSQFWAKLNGHLYTVSGAIYEPESSSNVPSHFYKIYLDYQEPEQKGIAFLFSNDGKQQAIKDCAVSIQSLEEKTGINFFPELKDAQIQQMEEQADLSSWPIL